MSSLFLTDQDWFLQNAFLSLDTSSLRQCREVNTEWRSFIERRVRGCKRYKSALTRRLWKEFHPIKNKLMVNDSAVEIVVSEDNMSQADHAPCVVCSIPCLTCSTVNYCSTTWRLDKVQSFTSYYSGGALYYLYRHIFGHYSSKQIAPLVLWILIVCQNTMSLINLRQTKKTRSSFEHFFKLFALISWRTQETWSIVCSVDKNRCPDT